MTKPKAILATDLHLDKETIEEVDKVLDQLISKTLELGLDTIYILGDIFTERVGQGLSVLLAWKKFLGKCKKKGLIVIKIAGNHDKTFLDSQESYLDVFNEDNVHIVTDYQCIVDGNMSFSLLPYFKEGKAYDKMLASLLEESRKSMSDCKFNYLFTHIAINGVRNNDGSVVEEGVKIGKFSLYDKVFVGHYHNKSKVGDNIYYIGSIMPRNYGEDNEKGFTIIYADGTHELFVPKFRKYKKFVFDLDKVKKVAIVKLRNKYRNSSDHIRFVFKGTEEQLLSLDKKFFTDVGIDVKKESKQILKSVEAAESGEFVSFDKSNILKCFKDYCSVNQFSGREKAVGLKYLARI